MKKPSIRQATRSSAKRVTTEQEDARSRHVFSEGNRRVIRASREAMGAIKYKAE